MMLMIEDKLFDKGCELFEQGLYEKAVNIFSKSIKKHPKNEVAWYKKGVALSRYGKLRDSIRCFEECLRINPDCDLAILGKAHSIEGLGNLEEANDIYDDFISISLDDIKIIDAMNCKIRNKQRLEKRGIKTTPQSKYEEAMWCVVGGEYEDAVYVFESLIKTTPDRYYLLHPYAFSLFKTQNIEKAIEITENILTRDKLKNYEVFMLQGKIYYETNDYQKAIKSYEMAREINETEAVRSALRKVNDKIYDEQEKKKKDLESRCLKGRLCLTSLDYKEGRNYFQEIIKEEPSYDDAWLYQGLSYLLEKNFDDAIESLNKTLELRPKSYRALMMLGGALYFLQKYDEAIEKFNILLEISPDYKVAKEFKEITIKAISGEVNELILTKIYYLFAARFRYSELTGKFLKIPRSS